MSLKKFHLFFITVSLSLMVFVGAWAAYQFHRGEAWVGTGVMAIIGFIAGLFYANWFRVKYKNL